MRRLARPVWLIAALQVAVLIATSTRYGYHRDELYFIVAGGHPAFGYPDQPPLVPLLAWAMNAIAPRSLLALRAPSALIAGLTTVLAAAIAAELEGDRRAQVIAAACTAVSGFALAVAHLTSTTTPDLLDTTLLGWLAIRVVRGQSGPALLAAGLVVGLGTEAKPQVGLVALVMAASLLALGPRDMLRTRWAAAAALLAIALAAPYIVWQAVHHWPQQTVARNIAGSQEGGRVGFIPFQLVMVSPVLVPVWIAGLRAPFRRRKWKDLRFIPVAYVVVGLIYLVGNGHAYYLASLYPLLLGLGAIPTAQWTRRHRRQRDGASGRGRLTLLTAAILFSAAFSSVIALPVVPVRKLQGSLTIALNSAQGDTVGWPAFVAEIDRAYRTLPPAERAHTAIFTGNYGEAGAVDVLGRRLGLPRAYSGHNGFSEWGVPPARDTHALVLGFDDAAQAAPQFADCRTLGRFNDHVGLDNAEQGLPIMLCAPTRSWPALWPSLTHFD